jgi:hypothetical protein
MATPGRNMATASAWKNFRRAFRLRVGTCLSAASKNSVAAWLTPLPLGNAGRVGKGGNEMPRLVADAGGVFAALASVEGVTSTPVLDKSTFVSLAVAVGRGRYRRERAS